MISNDRYTIPKVRILSDLHMEGYKYNYNPIGEDILILAGDIHTKSQHGRLLDNIPDSIQIIMVAGNHSFYLSSFEKEIEYLTSLEETYKNFVFLNNSSFVYNDIHFYGGTMFSDFLLYGEGNRYAAELESKYGINDFRVIRGWTTTKHKEQHELFVKNMQPFLELPINSKRVVVSHFCPSMSSIDAKYHNQLLNAYFTSDMEKFMGDIQYWFHGHAHSSFDYYKGNTRIICNPKGYGNENPNFNNNLLIDLEF